MEIRTINLEVGQTFIANNNEYIIKDTLSIERFARASDLTQDIFRGRIDESGEQNVLTKIFASAYKGELAQVAVIAHNRITDLKNKQDIGNPILRLCAQFINKVGEDERRISEEMELAKIKDWAEEGLSFESFLPFSQTHLSHILRMHEKHIADILAKKKTLIDLMGESLDTISLTLEKQQSNQQN